MQAFGPYLPTMVGGAADLYHSTFTEFEGDAHFTGAGSGRNVAWGVREHGMGAAVNGLALHGGIVKPFGSTFFVFTDYMRPPIRLSAIMGIDPVWIFTHDSVAVGEDGPTHQPVEHLAAMRAIPKLTVIRPSDATEVVEAWRTIIEDIEGPALLVLSRQDVPVLDRSTLGAAEGLRKGAYVLADEDSPDVVLVATGAEVSTALGAREILAGSGVRARDRLDAELGALRGPDRRLPRRDPSGRRAEDLRRGRRDLRLVALGRRVDRDRHVRRVGQGPRGARALRDQPGRRRRERPGEARRAGEGLASDLKVTVGLTPAEQVAAPIGIVIDVLRATSVICQAFAGGYESVTCVGEVEDARALAGPGVALAGERHNVRIEGFDYGNSPREFAEPHATKKLVLTTTNGTRALLAAAERCETVLVASLLNLGAVAEAARGRRGRRDPLRRGRGRVRDRRRLRRGPASRPRSVASPTTRRLRPPVSRARSAPPRKGSAAA